LNLLNVKWPLRVIGVHQIKDSWTQGKKKTFAQHAFVFAECFIKLLKLPNVM